MLDTYISYNFFYILLYILLFLSTFLFLLLLLLLLLFLLFFKQIILERKVYKLLMVNVLFNNNEYQFKPNKYY